MKFQAVQRSECSKYEACALFSRFHNLRLTATTSADPEGRQDLPEKSQNIGFLTNTVPDPLKNHEVTKPSFNVWPFKWRFAGGLMMTHL